MRYLITGLAVVMIELLLLTIGALDTQSIQSPALILGNVACSILIVVGCYKVVNYQIYIK